MTAAAVLAGRARHHAAAKKTEPGALIDRIAREKLAAANASAIGIYLNGSAIVHGYEKGRPARTITGQTVFGIGSNTKVFTASILAAQCIAGKRTLDEHVARSLPAGVEKRGKAIKSITLRQLATHTASFPDSIPNEAHETLFVGKPPPADEVRWWTDWQNAASRGNPCGGKHPGSCWNYSNWGFITLGYALADSNSRGLTYPELLKSLVTTPLQLERTGADVRLGVKGFSRSGTAYKTPPPDLKSNADDMLRFMRANLGALPSVPSNLERALKFSQEVHWSGSPASDKMGLAWQLGNPGIIWKNGESTGFTSFIGMIPAKKIAIVVLTNRDAVPATGAGFEFLHAMLR